MNTHDNEENSLPMQMGMLLLDQPAHLNVDGLKEILGEYLSDDMMTVTAQPDSQDAFILDYHGDVFALMMIPKAVPEGTFQTALKTSHNADLAQAIVSQQKAHFILSTLSAPEDMGTALTMAGKAVHLSAIIGSSTNAIGSYWSTAETLIGMEELIDHTGKILNAMPRIFQGDASASADLPLPYWVGLRLFKVDGKVGAQTDGFRIFSGYEFQLSPFKQDHGQAAQWVYAIVQYVLGSGVELVDGNTLELSPDHIFRLRFVEGTSQHSPMMVMDLDVNAKM